MAHTRVRPQLPPVPRRVYEPASNKVAEVQSEEISLRQPVQMPGLQPHADDIDVTAARHFRRQQRVPGIGQKPVGSLPTAMQEIEQNEKNRQIANYKCHFQSKDRFVNPGYGTEKKLSARWIWAR